MRFQLPNLNWCRISEPSTVPCHPYHPYRQLSPASTKSRKARSEVVDLKASRRRADLGRKRTRVFSWHNENTRGMKSSWSLNLYQWYVHVDFNDDIILYTTLWFVSVWEFWDLHWKLKLSHESTRISLDLKALVFLFVNMFESFNLYIPVNQLIAMTCLKYGPTNVQCSLIVSSNID